ncbi:MAG: DUF4982 domain-containing protein [Clostridia bacterium]|nr:DUF4982 domain-containing protein [Clostridia bacterium]
MDMNRIPFMQGWRFALTKDGRAVCEDYDDSAFEPVTLPHDWQIRQTRREDAPGGASQGFFPREHVGVYRLRFTAPAEWAGKTVRVLFDGIQRFSEVYLNGQRIGGRPYGYVPVLCNMTQALRIGGENLLAVRVDNSRPEGDTSYNAGGDRWYSGAGVYRKVWLLVDDGARIAHDGVSVMAHPVMGGPAGDIPDVAGIRCVRADVQIAVETEGAEGMALHAQVCGADGAVVYEQTLPALPVTAFAFSMEKPRLWSPDTPNLYTLRLTLGGDEHMVRFGVRSAVFDSEDGFILNGVKTKIWGVNLHHDGGAVGAAVPVEIWRRRLAALKRMGVNTIRASHNPMAEEVYDLCDEMGFLVVDELYDKWSRSNMYYDRLYDQWHLQDAEAMVRRDRCHPSIILWSVGNEVGHQYSELFYQCLKTLCDHVRRLDPTRAVTAVLIGFCLPEYNDLTPLGQRIAAAKRYAEIVDVFCGNYMEQFYEKLREAGMLKPIIGSEVRMYYRMDERTMNNVQVSPENPYAIVKRYDWVCGAILWAGVDYLGESTMWPQRGWTGNPLDSTADWKLRAWYCASHFKKEPVLKLCVYDEADPWDGARGFWGFPQMRAHWKYRCFEKVLHVAAMTNCDRVELYQNSQTVRTARLADFPDGMVHFYLPYIPGMLRAVGYRSGLKVCEDILYTDHEAVTLKAVCDRTQIPADGHSVAMIDLLLEDAHGVRYMLEDRAVRAELSGAEAKVIMDNGDPWSLEPFEKTQTTLHNGHLLILVQAGTKPGITDVTIHTEGFEPRTFTLTWTNP